MILFTFSCDEVGEAGISSILCELLKDSGPFHEWVMRPFARSYLRQGIFEEMILFAFSYDEVSEAGISNILCKLLKDSVPFHEWVMRPFARPYLRHSPGMEITVR